MPRIQKISINMVDGNDTCVKIYNPAEKKLIAVYENYKKAANKLGTTPSVIQHACARKGRTYSPTLQMEIATRISAVKEGDKEKIEICNRKQTL